MTVRSLRFTELRVDRLPGVPPGGGFALRDLSPDVTLVHGPNGTGKTLSGRALLDLVWPAHGDPRGRLVAGGWRLDDEAWSVQLDGGHVTWRRDGAVADPPALPPGELRPHHWLGLREMLADDGPDDERPGAFARRIAREMLGDYDLDGAAAELGFAASPPRPRKLRQAVDERTRTLESAREAARARHEDGERLEDLERRHAAAIAAERAVGRLEQALARRRLADELAAVEAALAAAPPAMDRLVGDEAERVAQRRAERTARAAEAEAAERRVAEAAAAARETALPEGGVPDAELAAMEEDVEAIAAAARAVDELDEQLAGATAAEAAARTALAGTADEAALAGLGPGVPERLARHAADRAALRSARAEAEAAVRQAEAALRTAEEELAASAGRLEDLRRGRDALAAWLAAPADAPTGPAPGGGWWGVALAAGLAAMLGVVLAAVMHPAWLLATVAAIAIAVADRLAAGRAARSAAAAPETDGRAAREAEVRRLGLAAPDAWTPDAVRSALDELLRRIAGAERAEADRAAAAGRVADARDRSAAIEERARELEAERAELERSLGLGIDAARSDWLVVLGTHLAAWHEARGRRRQLEARRAEALEHRRERSEALAARLRSNVGAGGTEEGDDGAAWSAESLLDPSTARGRVRDLRGRTEARRRAEAEAAAAARDRDRARGELDRLARELASVFASLGLEPGDDAGLARLLEARPDHEAARQRARDLRGQRDAIDRALGEGAEERDAEPAALEARLDAARADAARRDELADEMGRIRERVDAARRGRDVEEAARALDAARDELRAAGEGDEAAMVGDAVAGWLRAEAAERSRPAVLRAATGHFRRITHGRYELEVVDEDGTPAFVARDTRDELRKRLDELSAGERVQLLLSVRLGFLEQAEGAVRLPVVLDEILGTTDDERAAAIIDAVIEICRAGRQVISFTAQPDEVGKWRARLAAEPGIELREIDLARVRALAEAESAPLPIDPPPPPAIPAPGGLDHAAYGRVLDVPGLRPLGPAGSVHLWHVIDEPELLHRLLVRRIRHLGPFRTLARAAGAGALADLPPATVAAVEARAAALEAAFAAWRVGRGRPVDRAVLEASGAVSSRFIDDVAALASACGGDAAALLAGLAEGAVKGFQARKAEELRAHLEEHGHLDPEPRLDAEGIHRRVLAAVGRDLAEGRLDVDWLDRTIACLPEVPGAAGDRAAGEGSGATPVPAAPPGDEDDDRAAAVGEPPADGSA